MSAFRRTRCSSLATAEPRASGWVGRNRASSSRLLTRKMRVRGKISRAVNLVHPSTMQATRRERRPGWRHIISRVCIGFGEQSGRCNLRFFCLHTLVRNCSIVHIGLSYNMHHVKLASRRSVDAFALGTLLALLMSLLRFRDCSDAEMCRSDVVLALKAFFFLTREIHPCFQAYVPASRRLLADRW